MPRKTFMLLLAGLSSLVILTGLPLIQPFHQDNPDPSPVIRPTSLSTSTPDPFAAVPLATTQTGGVIQSLPAPVPGQLPVTATPVLLLPDPIVTAQAMSKGTFPAPVPATMPPDRLTITRLALDVEVVPVGMAPVPGPGAFVTAAMTPGQAAAWLNTSASFGRPGNTVLAGGPAVFQGLWTLETGDEIVIYAAGQEQRYIVAVVLILPEQDQPLDVRVANAAYIRPGDDERLTLVTGWPAGGNSHRTVVVAYPASYPE